MSEQEERMKKGMELVGRLFAGAPVADGGPLPDEFRRHTIEHLFGDVWQGEALPVEERSLITCVALVALNREAEQRLHFTGAKNLGVRREKLEAAITHVMHYAGWPVGASAFRVLNEVWPVDG